MAEVVWPLLSFLRTSYGHFLNWNVLFYFNQLYLWNWFLFWDAARENGFDWKGLGFFMPFFDLGWLCLSLFNRTSIWRLEKLFRNFTTALRTMAVKPANIINNLCNKGILRRLSRGTHQDLILFIVFLNLRDNGHATADIDIFQLLGTWLMVIQVDEPYDAFWIDRPDHRGDLLLGVLFLCRSFIRDHWFHVRAFLRVGGVGLVGGHWLKEIHSVNDHLCLPLKLACIFISFDYHNDVFIATGVTHGRAAQLNPVAIPE